MTQDQRTGPPTGVSPIQEGEFRLVKVRRQLEDTFRSLHLVCDQVSVCAGAARAEGMLEIGNVLSLCICNQLLGELRALSRVVEDLGGKTSLTDKEETSKEITED